MANNVVGATIAKVESDNTVKEIELHSGGQLEYTGLVLSKYYHNDSKKIDSLIRLGKILLIGPYLGTPPCLKKYGQKAVLMARKVVEENPKTKMEMQAHTMAFYRDCGQPYDPGKSFTDLETYYQAIAKRNDSQNRYLYIDDVWYVIMKNSHGQWTRPQLLSELV